MSEIMLKAGLVGYQALVADLESRLAATQAEILRLKAALETSKDDILAVYDECAGVAVPPRSRSFGQIEVYRSTIRQLKARAVARSQDGEEGA